MSAYGLSLGPDESLSSPQYVGNFTLETHADIQLGFSIIHHHGVTSHASGGAEGIPEPESVYALLGSVGEPLAMSQITGLNRLSWIKRQDGHPKARPAKPAIFQRLMLGCNSLPQGCQGWAGRRIVAKSLPLPYDILCCVVQIG